MTTPPDQLNARLPAPEHFSRRTAQEIAARERRDRENLRAIPKALHQIWLGDSPIPETLRGFMASLRAMHPVWGYRLWTEADLPALWPHDTFGLKALFDSWDNHGFRSDIVRLLILFAFGGVYLDADCEPLRPLDPLAETSDCFIGATFEPQPYPDVLVENAVVGARAGHPYIEMACRDLPKNVAKWRDPENLIDSILECTGPSYLSRTLTRYRADRLSVQSDVAVIPRRLLYPVPAWGGEWPATTDAFVRHHWDGSWHKRDN